MIVILKVKEIEFLYSINSMPAECLGVLAGTMVTGIIFFHHYYCAINDCYGLC
jgi:hypothetical protein